jgi:hypothetical protein
VQVLYEFTPDQTLLIFWVVRYSLSQDCCRHKTDIWLVPLVNVHCMDDSQEDAFKAKIVWLISNGGAEEALSMLAEHYKVGTPRLKVGLPKGRKISAVGCYEARNKTISVLNSDILKDPLVVIHEFYHHLRTKIDLQHKGTEKNADRFAKGFIAAYMIETQGSP